MSTGLDVVGTSLKRVDRFTCLVLNHFLKNVLNVTTMFTGTSKHGCILG